MKDNKGITLIALVITIIILLILVGVTIVTLTGKNGILSKGNAAQKETEEKSAKEKVQLEVIASYDEDRKINMDSLNKNLKNNISGLTYNGKLLSEENLIKELPAMINVDGYDIEISEIGNIIVKGRGKTPISSIEDTSGANEPELKDEMIAITFDEKGKPQTVKDTSKNTWYSYEITTDDDMKDGGTTEGGNSRWANAIRKDENGNINEYYVWIPRYAYKIDNSVTYTSQSGTSHKIDVKFIEKEVNQQNIEEKLGSEYEDYIVHPAFTFGEQELSGFWVGKYETTGTTDKPNILPNRNSFINGNVSTMFQVVQSLSKENTDAHMMKNIEWGAVAYLAQSPYGRNGTEVSVNQCSDYYTGVGTGSGDNKIYNSTYTWNEIKEEQKYNGKIGKLASTTGNIYGIYDMSGGTLEYVMGIYQEENGNIHVGNSEKWNSGFNGYLYNGTQKTNGIDLPNEKYYDLYINETDSSGNYKNGKKGDATEEIIKWNNDGNEFIYSYHSFFSRGNSYRNEKNSGLFSFTGRDGSHEESRFRACVTMK